MGLEGQSGLDFWLNTFYLSSGLSQRSGTLGVEPGLGGWGDGLGV